MSQRQNPNLQPSGGRLTRHSRSFLAVLMIAITLVQVGQLARPEPVAAAPGSPGTPSSTSAVYREDFENVTGSDAISLTSYVGDNGETYTADPYWLNAAACNGTIYKFTSTFPPPLCATPERADALGQVDAGVIGGPSGSPVDGSNAATQENHALSADTLPAAGNGVANGVVFQTGDLDLVAGSTRYYNLSVDVAEQGCRIAGGSNVSRLLFTLVSGASSFPLTGLRLCTDARAASYKTGPAGNEVLAGRFFSSVSALLTPAQVADLSIVIRNAENLPQGNDTAIDNLQLVDATPQLDQSFSPATGSIGFPSTLTFTVTNRSDLASKLDWSFTDALPSGLLIAETPNIGGTCTDVGGASLVTTAPASGNTITVTGGDLAAGESSCTITVDVSSMTAGTYTNGPSNITSITGLDLPGEDSVAFTSAPCTSSRIFIAHEFVTQLSEQIYGSGSAAFVDIGPAVPDYNSIGYNPVDGLLYGIRGAGAGPVVRIDPVTGATVNLPLFVNQPAPLPNAGAFDEAGNYYAASWIGSVLHRFDVAAMTHTQIPLSRALDRYADFTFLPGDSTYAWGPERTGGFITRLNVLTGALTRYSVPFLPNPGNAYGSAWTYANGNIGVQANATGVIYQVAIADPTGTPTFTLVNQAQGIPAEANDGTSCLGPPTDLGIVKSAASATGVAGGSVAWTLTVTNHGPNPSSGFTVTDAIPAGISGASTSTPGCAVTSGVLTCSGAALADGASSAITLTGTLPTPFTSPITNSATVLGNEADPNPANDTDDHTIALAAPVLDLVKSAGVPVDANGSGLTDAGDTIQYTFTVTNTGSAPATNLVVNDPLVGSVTCDVTSLAPGASASCVADAVYVISPADEAAGSVHNLATASADDSGGNPVTPPASDETDTPVATPTPGLSMSKQAGTPVDVNSDGLVDAGDTIAYTFTVTNTGNVPVTGINVSDPRAGAVTCVVTTLAVGSSTSCAADNVYVITVGDEAAGSVDNVAVGRGTDPDGDPVVTPPTGGSTSTPVVRPVAEIAVSKAVIGAPVSNGDGTWNVTYQLVARNTGNGPGSYDLTDELHFGEGVSVISADATNTLPGSIPLNDGWDGSSDTDVATDVSIAAGARHEYRVVVTAGVAPDVTRSFTDCELEPGEPGTGFLNEASVRVPAGGQNPALRSVRAHKAAPVSACAPVGVVTVEKELVETRYAATGGGVTAIYVLTVTNIGSGPADYALTDKLMWASGIDIRSALVTATPAGERASSTWNGVSDTFITDEGSLEAGDSEVWEITVEGRIPSTLTASERDCSLTSAEDGTGLLNTASVDDDGVAGGSDACEEALAPDQVQQGQAGPPGQGGGSPGHTSIVRTGIEVGGLTALGVVLLLLGLGMLGFGRRRHSGTR